VVELGPSDIAAVDCGYWANLRQVRLQSGAFTFHDHEYQVEPMSGMERRRCVMKATQGGFTELEVLSSLWGMLYGHYPQGVLYLFPTSDDVNEFSKSRFNPLITDNRTSIGRYVKSGGKGTDTASLKKIRDSFLYLRGARLSQKISDINESSKLKSIPVDRVVFDEVDHMDDEVVSKALGRMGHSKVKQERYLSNPIVPGEGIDRLFQKSDQRHWFRLCGCGHWTCAELEFPECVKVRKDGTGYIACGKCGEPVPVWSGPDTGKWVPQVPSNSDYMYGYRWSQLSSSFNDPAEILADFANPPDGNLADVYRLRLGLPYIPAEDRLTVSQVYDCCCNDEQSVSHPGPCAMGVDVGIVKHVVIGTRSSDKQYDIFKVAAVSEWSDIHDLAKKFNVKSAVIDIRPYQDSAKMFQKQEPYSVFLCEYSNNPAYMRTWDTKLGVVKDYRTALFDETHRVVTTPGMLRIPRLSPAIKEFASQLCDSYKLLETNKRTGAREYRYKGSNDHYRNALNYFVLAASRSSIARRSGIKPRRQLVANNSYKVI